MLFMHVLIFTYAYMLILILFVHTLYYGHPNT